MLLSVVCLTLSNSNWVAGPIYHASCALNNIALWTSGNAKAFNHVSSTHCIGFCQKKKKTHSSNSQGCHPARKWNCCCRFSSAWAIIYLLLLWRRWLQNTRPAGTVAPPIFSLSLSLSLYLYPPLCLCCCSALCSFQKTLRRFLAAVSYGEFLWQLAGNASLVYAAKKKKNKKKGIRCKQQEKAVAKG